MSLAVRYCVWRMACVCVCVCSDALKNEDEDEDEDEDERRARSARDVLINGSIEAHHPPSARRAVASIYRVAG